MDTVSPRTQSDDILENQIALSLKRHQRSPLSLFLSALSAGLEIGFSLLLMAALYTHINGSVSSDILYLLVAFGYPIGFLLIVIGDSDLFTEHTTNAMYPVLNGQTSLSRLMRTWGIILSGNLIGGFIFSAFLYVLLPAFGSIEVSSVVSIAEKVLAASTLGIILSAILAGWLMGLLAWLVVSAKETISEIIVVILITTVIGVIGLHHSIVGSIEVFSGMLLSPSITLADYVRFEVLAILGNAIGGVIFVAVMKYSLRTQSANV